MSVTAQYPLPSAELRAAPVARERTWLGREPVLSIDHDTGLLDVNGVRGYLLVGDLLQLTHCMSRLPVGATVVEIGSFMGLSSIIMATALLDGGNDGARIFCVDTWAGSSEHAVLGRDFLDRLYGVFCANVRAAGVDAIIHPVRMCSTEAAARFAPASVDLLFIDGDHSREACYADLVAWFPAVRPEGVVVGHDCTPDGGVRQAVEQFCAERGLTHSIVEPPLAHYLFELHRP